MTVPITQERKAILCLFDFTGNWSQPYREQGYEVVQIDIQLGTDILTWTYRSYPRTYFSGILAAVPCSDFALSGSRWFREKDANGHTYESMALVYKTLAIIQWFQPGLRWWVIENPMSRIHMLCKDLAHIRMSFDPYEFARSDPGILHISVPVCCVPISTRAWKSYVYIWITGIITQYPMVIIFLRRRDTRKE